MIVNQKPGKSISQSILFFAMLFSVTAIWTSCEEDYVYVAPPAQGTMSFSADIQPILTANCSMSGCHDGDNYDPDLREGFSYTAMFNIPGCIDTIAPAGSDLYVRINDQVGAPGFMPDGGNRLPQSDINKVLLWIEQGAKNN